MRAAPIRMKVSWMKTSTVQAYLRMMRAKSAELIIVTHDSEVLVVWPSTAIGPRPIAVPSTSSAVAQTQSLLLKIGMPASLASANARLLSE